MKFTSSQPTIKLKPETQNFISLDKFNNLLITSMSNTWKTGICAKIDFQALIENKLHSCGGGKSQKALSLKRINFVIEIGLFTTLDSMLCVCEHLNIAQIYHDKFVVFRLKDYKECLDDIQDFISVVSLVA